MKREEGFGEGGMEERGWRKGRGRRPGSGEETGEVREGKRGFGDGRVSEYGK